MARRSKSRKPSNLEPSVMTLSFALDNVTAGAIGTWTADLSQIASLVNRRFYRQGLNWAVAGFKLFVNPSSAAPPGSTGSLGVGIISKLPNTWVMGNAWEKSMRTWSKMNNEALIESDGIRPRFLDFKVYADAIHHASGYANNIIPIGYNLGEWEPSKIYVPIARDTTQAPGLDQLVDLELVAVGASYPGAGSSGLNAVSLIEGYAASRGLPEIRDPNAPDDAADTVGSSPQNWMTAIFNEGETQSHEIIEDLLLENNQAPYPFENDGVNLDTMYPGGANQAGFLQIHDTDYVTGTTIGGSTRFKGGNFPCGLVRLSYENQKDFTSFVSLQIELIPGNHRGYLCEPMTEM
jgi:hypothetical protein